MLAEGLARALRRWRLMLPLAGFSLLLSAAQSWPALFVPQELARSPLLAQLAQNDGDALTILLSSPEAFALSTPLLFWGIMALGAALLSWLAYSFCAGGMLAGLRGEPFWAGGRRHFWSFLALSLLLGIAALVLLALLAAASRAIGWRWAAGIALVLLQLLNLRGELARAYGVASGRRNPFVLLGRSGRAFWRHIPAALLVGALGLGLHLGMAALYVGAAELLIGSALASIALQQLALLAWQWVKLLRLSWALAFVERHAAR